MKYVKLPLPAPGLVAVGTALSSTTLSTPVRGAAAGATFFAGTFLATVFLATFLCDLAAIVERSYRLTAPKTLLARSGVVSPDDRRSRRANR